MDNLRPPFELYLIRFVDIDDWPWRSKDPGPAYRHRRLIRQDRELERRQRRNGCVAPAEDHAQHDQATGEVHPFRVGTDRLRVVRWLRRDVDWKWMPGQEDARRRSKPHRFGHSIPSIAGLEGSPWKLNRSL